MVFFQTVINYYQLKIFDQFNEYKQRLYILGSFIKVLKSADSFNNYLPTGCPIKDKIF